MVIEFSAQPIYLATIV